MTVVDPQQAGYLTVWPSGTSSRATSNLNFQAGQTIATTVIVPVSDDWRCGCSTAPPAPCSVHRRRHRFHAVRDTDGAGTMGPVTARIADSRSVCRSRVRCRRSGTVAVQVAAPGSGVAAAVLTVTVVDPQAGGYLHGVAVRDRPARHVEPELPGRADIATTVDRPGRPGRQDPAVQRLARGGAT